MVGGIGTQDLDIRIHYEVNAVDTYTVSYLQIEKGSSATSYEPYGVMPSPEFPSKLVSIGYENLLANNLATKTVSGITITNNGDGTYILNGTATADVSEAINNDFISMSGTWRLQGCANGGSSNTYMLSAYVGYWSTASPNIDTGEGTYITYTGNVKVRFYIKSGTTCNNLLFKPMIVEDAEEHDFVPYGKYGIGIKIGDNQNNSKTYSYTLDEPLRAIGNVKDKLYLQNGVIYIERNIGYKQILSSMSMYILNILTFSKEMRVSLSDIGNVSTTATDSDLLSNDFIGSSTWDVDKIGIMGYAGNPVNSIAFRIPVSDDNTFFDNNTTFLQYILQTPKIETLGKLEIPNAYEGENNLSLYVGDLQATIDVYYYWKNCDVLFAGVVKNSGDISLNPRYPHYCSLQILDYKTFLSESNTLDFVIAGKTIEQAIEMVVEAISGYGFVVGEIDIAEADDVIGAYSTLNKTAYDVFQYLAEISGSRWRARYIDSLTMAIDFDEPNTLPQADDIEYTKQYWEDNNIVDLTFNYGKRDYRNKQILLSDEVYATINYDEVLIANGYTNNYTLQNNIASVVKILINDDEKTVATINEKQMGIDADFYYTPGKNILESNNIYSAGTIIHLTYQPLVKGRQIVYNNDEVDRISQQTDTVGVIARYETRNDVLSSDELEKIALTYIEYKGKPEIVLKLTTQDKDLFNIGEVVYFNAPIEELAQNYMIKSKETQYIIETENGGINLFYVYEMTSSFNSEKAINYFDNQRNKASGNISQGENITRNIDIETQAKIIWSEGTVSSTTVTVVGDNVLNSALNSPLVE
jgi:hypothetical protein